MHNKLVSYEVRFPWSPARFYFTIFQELEHRLAQFHQREDAILYGSCFDANAGLFESMLTPEDAVFSDALNHASIIDGIRLCKAQKYRYPHRDLNGEEDSIYSNAKATFKEPSLLLSAKNQTPQFYFYPKYRPLVSL